MSKAAASTTTGGKPGEGRYFRDQLVIQWVLLALGLLLTGGWLAHGLIAEYNRTYADQKERLANQARMIDRNLGHQFGALKNTLDMLAGEYLTGTHNSVPGALGHYLKDLTTATPGISALLIQDVMGVVTDASAPDLPGSDFSDREFFKRPMAPARGDRPRLAPPFRSDQNAFVLPYSRRIAGMDGQTRGVVTAALDAEFFRTFLSSTLYAPDMWAAMAHGEGEVFIVAPERPGFEGKNLAVPGSFFSRHLESGEVESVFAGEVHLTGEERLIAIRTISVGGWLSGGADTLVLAVSRDLAVIHEAWRYDLFMESLLFTLLVVTMCGGLFHHQTGQRAARERGIAQARELRLLSEEYDRFFALSPDLFCIIDVSGKMRRTNTAWRDALGYGAEELNGRFYLDLVHPDDREETLKVHRLMRKGEAVTNFINRCVAADGNWRFIEWHSTPYTGGWAYAVARDVTERRAAEAEREKLVGDLTRALGEVKTLSGLLPICSSCHKIRDDQGYWNILEKYICEHSGAEFTHGICPECIKKLYPEYSGKE